MADRRTLFVQNLSTKASRDDLWGAFAIFGDLVDVKISENKLTALVEFQEEGDASAEKENMDLSEIYGQTILVTYATKGNFVDKRKAIWDTVDPSMGNPNMLE